jgi:hypothetical protein
LEQLGDVGQLSWLLFGLLHQLLFQKVTHSLEHLLLLEVVKLKHILANQVFSRVVERKLPREFHTRAAASNQRQPCHSFAPFQLMLLHQLSALEVCLLQLLNQVG